jgi:hypothetical protein
VLVELLQVPCSRRSMPIIKSPTTI